jgi:hypothetical protein
MKKIFKIRFVILFIALTMQFSCSNYLELIPPNGLIREEFWKTKEDVEAVLMGSYLQLASMSGNLFTYGESSDQNKLMQSNIYPDNGLCNWGGFYTLINYCNEVIKNAPEVKKIDKTFNDYQLQAFLSEAYFLRSLSYFYLVRIFKDVPLILEPSETDGDNFYPTQTKGEDVLKQVMADLNEYRQYATTNGYKTTDEVKGRATKASFDALLADIALWNFDYEACIGYTNRIIADNTIQMMPGARWFEIFYPGNSFEGIFEIQFDDQLKQPNALYDMTRRDANQYLPSQRALELFARKYTPIQGNRGEDATITMQSEDNYLIWKYAGLNPDGKTVRPGSVQKSCNFIVYRLADVYLMKAEALSQLSRFSEANVILNMIRDRAQVAPLAVGSSVSAWEDAILDERALELAFEGKRWFDLLRMGRRNNYSRKDKLVELIVKSVPSTQKRILAAKLTNPLGWYLPVQKGEFERNKNLVQNPYYNY